MAEVVATNISGSEISSEIDLELEQVPKRLRSKVRREVGDYLVEQTLLSLGDAKSPVAGASYKKTLSKNYREFKKESGRGTTANLEFDGDMKDSLKYKSTDSGIKLGHFKSSEAAKADGHNNFSGESDLPERRYLPKEGESYKREIQSEVDKIIQDVIVSTAPISTAKLKTVTSKAQFWDMLALSFEGLSKPDIKSAVKRNTGFIDTLNTLGLLRWLK